MSGAAQPLRDTTPPQPDVTSHGAVQASEVVTTVAPLAAFTTRLGELLEAPTSPEVWAEFQNTLEEGTMVATSVAKLPAPRDPDGPRRDTDPGDARAIQRLYRRNRRGAVRCLE